MANNNKNIKSGFKFLSWSFLLLTIASWLAGTFYIGGQTEKQIRLALVQSEDQPSTSNLYLDLLDYKRTFFDAKLRTRLRSNNTELDEMVNTLVFSTRIKHGPLIFNQHDLQLATATLSTRLDMASINPEVEERLEGLFADKEPFLGSVVVDYGLRKHFKFAVSALDYQVAEMKLSVSAGTANGVIPPESKTMPITFEFDEISINHGKYSNNSMLSMQNSLVLNLFENNDAREEIRLESTLARSATADYTGLVMNLQHLQWGHLRDLLEVYENRHSLDQQIAWTLELAAQHQEGQDRLITLYRQQENTELPTALITQLFENSDEDVSFIHKIEHQNASLAYNDSQEYLFE